MYRDTNRSITDYTFHHYINPCRLIDASAIAVHGITNEKLKNEPIFSDIKDKFISYVNGSEVIAHNAPFDIGLEKESMIVYQHQSDKFIFEGT